MLWADIPQMETSLTRFRERIALLAIFKKYREAGFLIEPTPIVGCTCLAAPFPPIVRFARPSCNESDCSIPGLKWDSFLHAFWSCLLVEHEQPVSRFRARRGGSKQSWLRRDQLAEALEEIKSVEPDAGGGRTRIKAHRSRCRFRQLAIKLPGLLGDGSWNRTVLWHRADKLLLRPVPEQVVGGHRKPPSRVPVGEATIRQLSYLCRASLR